MSHGYTMIDIQELNFQKNGLGEMIPKHFFQKRKGEWFYEEKVISSTFISKHDF